MAYRILFAMWGSLLLAGAAYGDPPASLAGYNYVVGTQTIGPKYRFTEQTALVETAQATLDLGSNILKISLSRDYGNGSYPGVVPNPAIHSLRDLAHDEPSFRHVLDMPFRHYLLWTYSFSAGWWDHGFAAKDAAAEYREIYDFTRYLLTAYNRSGKTFLLGHWEGDWYLHPGYDSKHDPDPQAVQGMIDWLNTRQKAIEDAKRDTKHTDVEVRQYTEVNLVQKAMQGGHTLTNDVLPKTTVDYVSYSSYDSLLGEGAPLRNSLQKALDYIETKLPPKSGISGKRVFIGEYGFPAQSVGAEKQADRSRDVIQAGLEWGCPYILYWEMYNNEIKDGGQVGFWLIDDKGQKQAVYRLLHDFLGRAKAYTASFQNSHKRLPTISEYRRQALLLLTASTLSQQQN
jgi:hypothetical protein